MNDEPRESRIDERVTVLSLAVKLVDAVTGRQPRGNPRVRIEGSVAKPVQNPSGYHLFVDLEPVNDLVTVHVDAGERYRDASREVDLSDRDPRRPLTIDLAPAVAYEFPSGSTIVRGHVVGPDGTGVEGAFLSIRGIDSSTRTDENGEFVLSFGGNGDFVVERGDGEERTKRVQVAGEDPVLEVRESKDSDPVATVSLDGNEYLAIEEGAVHTMNIDIE